MGFSLERSNLKIDRLDLWKEAKSLSELHRLLNPAGCHSVGRVYRALLKFEERNAEKQSHDNKRKTLLHNEAHNKA